MYRRCNPPASCCAGVLWPAVQRQAAGRNVSLLQFQRNLRTEVKGFYIQMEHHYLLPFIIAGASIVHIAALHQYYCRFTSNSSVDKVSFYPSFNVIFTLKI